MNLCSDSFRLGLVMTCADNISAVQHVVSAHVASRVRSTRKAGSYEDQRNNTN